MKHPEHKSWCAVTHGYNTCTCALADEFKSCPCSCHKPAREARLPHHLTMIGKRCLCDEPAEKYFPRCPIHDP